MKKFIFSIFAASVISMFAACDCKSTTGNVENDSTIVDSVLVDSMVVDTVVVDSAVVLD